MVADLPSVLGSAMYSTAADRSSVGSTLLPVEKRPWILAQNTQFWCEFLHGLYVSRPVLNDLATQRDGLSINIYSVGLR